ncbi:polysaccharide lyase [Streptomyces sp. NPDC013157]|uniref:polysaccharide lyase n=1 Tax=Streptomyces sp. NPDC013157 TaxID=3364861 RepID=UPI0036D094D0
MRRRQFIMASGATVIGTGVAACSFGGPGGGTSGSPGRSTGPATPLSADPAAVAGFFGPRLTARQAGSFGLSRAGLLPGHHPVLGRVLRVHYPARSASPTVARQYGLPEGGAQIYLKLADGPVDLLHLRYYVRFPKYFDFVKGGKLPGLYGGTVTSGRRIPDGANGLSTRYMWRTHGAAEVYAYLPTSVAHGTSLGRGSWDWPLGRWVCVEQAVRLNRPGHFDGNVTVHVDGRQVLSRGGLEFRTTERLGIDGVLFSTFFGGSDPTWATPRSQYADFAAFAVADRPIDPLPGV